MKKKIVLGAFLATFIILGMGISSALNTTYKNKQKSEDLDKLDSPLFQILTNKAINNDKERKTLVQNFVIKFLGRFFNNRIFYRPFIELLKKIISGPQDITGGMDKTCEYTACSTCTQDKTCTSDYDCTDAPYCKI